jgi:hypothetical protein
MLPQVPVLVRRLRQRNQRLQLVRRPALSPVQWRQADTLAHEESLLTCARCGGNRLRRLESTSKPSWERLLDRRSPSCPSWYAESLEAAERRFWDATKGSGFYDWYLDYLEESAYSSSGCPDASDGPVSRGPARHERGTEDRPPSQRYLPGLDLTDLIDEPFHVRFF